MRLPPLMPPRILPSLRTRSPPGLRNVRVLLPRRQEVSDADQEELPQGRDCVF